MKSSCRVALCWLGVFCFVLSTHAQGPLVPPGAPAPSMKTLQQVEPRTPIDALPHVIIASGSYYVTGNIGPSGPGAGILVAASDVTIDLNGFVLQGDPADGAHGILVTPGLQNVTIRNGVIRDWGNDGIHASEVRNLHVESVIVHSCLGDGLDFSSGTVGGSHFHNNLGAGIQGSKPIPGIGIVVIKNPGSSSARENGGGGVVIEGDMDVEISAVITGNTGHGISWSPATPVDGLRLKLNDCHSSGNTGDGLHLSGVTSEPVLCEIFGGAFSHNGGAGIFSSKPVPGIGIVIKKQPPGPASTERNHGGGIVLEGDCDLDVSGMVVSRNTGDGIKWTSLNPGETPRIKLEDSVIGNNTGNGVIMVTVEPVEMDFTVTRSRFENNGVAGVDLHAPSLASDIRAVFTDCAILKNNGSGAKIRKGGPVFRPSQGEWRASHITDNSGPGLDLDGIGVELEGVHVHGNGEEGIRQVGGTIRITGGSVANNTKDGLKLDGKKHVKTGHVTLLKRTVFVNNGGNGVHISSSEDDAECRVIVHDSQLNGNTGNGLHLETTHPGSVAGLSWYNSQASHNDFSGIVVTGQAGTGKGSVTIRGGDCDDSGAHGVVIAHPEINAGLITGISVARNGGSGIVSAGQFISIIGNVVADNATAGIRVEGDGHFLDDNRCVNNPVGIELAGNNNALAKNVYGGPGAPYIDLTGTNPSAPIQDVTVGVNPLGNIVY